MAQAKSDYIVEVIGVDKAGAVFASVQQAMDGVTDSTVKASKSADKHLSITKQINKSYLSIRSAVSDVVSVVNMVVDGLKDIGREQSLERQVNAIVGAAGHLESLRQGLRDTVDDADLSAAVLSLERINVTAEQAGKIGLGTLALAEKKGVDGAEMLALVVGDLVSGSGRSLKRLGIDAKTTAERIEMLGNVGKQAGPELDKSLNVSIQRAEKHLDDLKDNFKLAGAGVLNFVVDLQNGFTDAETSWVELRKAVKKELDVSEEDLALAAAAGSDIVKGAFADVKDYLRDYNVYLTLVDPFTSGFAEIGEGAITMAAVVRTAFAGIKDAAAGGIGAALKGAATGPGWDAAYEKEYQKFYERIDAQLLAQSRRGGGGGRASAAGREPSYAEIFGFTGAEASFLGGFSGGTLGGAFGSAGGPDQGRQQGSGFGGRGEENTWLGAGGTLNAQAEEARAAAEAWAEVGDSMTSTFDSIGGAFTNLTDALTSSGAISKTGAASKAMAGIQIAAIVAVAGVKMAFEIAEALATTSNRPWEAATHYAAAAAYGVVAATNVASTISGVSGGGGGRSSSSRAGGGYASSADYGASKRAEQGAAPTYIIVNADTLVAGDRSAATWASQRLFPEMERRGHSLPPGVLRRYGRASAGL